MMNKKSILVIDDDKFFREILKDVLKDRYEVVEATGIEDLIKMATTLRPDLIILDIELPGKSGIELCRELKKEGHTRSTPVILLSSRAKKEEIIRGLQAGADDYLTKPLYPPEILARVDAHLRSKSYYSNLEHRDMQMLLELSDAISVLRNPMKILRIIVEKMADIIDVVRCSIVSISSCGELIVKASSDMPNDGDIVLKFERYPEISKALETRRAVIINDIRHDPLMASVRSFIEDLGFNSIIVVPIIKKESVIGTFLLRTATTLKGEDSERINKLCHLVANISANALENATLFESMKTAQEFLEEMAIRDGLTKLYTHRHFYDRLDEEFSRAIRHKEPLSLIFFDIDNFKQINDKFGHMYGDEVLRHIGRVIKEVVRESDIAARYGGEEFAVLLPHTELEGALEMARRLALMIRELRFESLKSRPITVSTGVSTFARNNLLSYDELVRLADQAMYNAKAAGKDRISVANGPSLHGEASALEK
jgi:two-component system cell cycle response regulator